MIEALKNDFKDDTISNPLSKHWNYMFMTVSRNCIIKCLDLHVHIAQ